jgi:hypothetical protein
MNYSECGSENSSGWPVDIWLVHEGFLRDRLKS